MNIQLNLTGQKWEILMQLTQPIPPESRYSNKDLDTIHPQWIGFKAKQIKSNNKLQYSRDSSIIQIAFFYLVAIAAFPPTSFMTVEYITENRILIGKSKHDKLISI